MFGIIEATGFFPIDLGALDVGGPLASSPLLLRKLSEPSAIGESCLRLLVQGGRFRSVIVVGVDSIPDEKE